MAHKIEKTPLLIFIPFCLLVLLLCSCNAQTAIHTGSAQELPQNLPDFSTPWWVWVLILLGFSFIVGIVSLLGGMGGGTLFVSIIGGFLPFHLDFVRCASLMVALSGALSAGPGLLRFGMGDLRLSLPAALMTSIGSSLGATLGLHLPARLVQSALAVLILIIVGIMVATKKLEYPQVKKADFLSGILGIKGIYRDRATGEEIRWQVHRTPLALLIFFIIGLIAGVFGIGAGWANVVALNLIMGAPLKIAIGTSKLIVCLTDTSAAWIYINSGAVLPILVIPSIIGMMLGSWLGVGILARTRPVRLRYIVIALLLFAGIRSLLKALNVWP
jgi:uncharacterized membrane protein YfcA